MVPESKCFCLEDMRRNSETASLLANKSHGDLTDSRNKTASRQSHGREEALLRGKTSSLSNLLSNEPVLVVYLALLTCKSSPSS
jgi:hypothetical protein